MQQTSAESLNPAIRIRTQNRIKSLCYTPRMVTCSSDFNIAARKLDTGYFLHLTSTGYNVVIIAFLESENSSLQQYHIVTQTLGLLTAPLSICLASPLLVPFQVVLRTARKHHCTVVDKTRAIKVAMPWCAWITAIFDYIVQGKRISVRSAGKNA